MSVSLIVSIYHSQADLPLLLSALSQQSKVPDEIIFAEDDISIDTVEILREGKKRYPHLKMKLVQHEDRGFRKAEIANKAVSIARNDKLVFLDGDCLPHRHYVKVYAENVTKDKLLNARPVRLFTRHRELFLDEEGGYRPPATISVLRLADPPRRYCIYLPFYPISQRYSAMYGSSWSCMKSQFLQVNGYDEQFCIGGYGYEDTDLSHRFNRLGVQCYVPKFRTIYYHFFDPGGAEAKEAGKRVNKQLLDANDKKYLVSCELGISQWMGKIEPVWTCD